ncbi:MAG: hypothetical protein M3413_12955 [Bacteroidota bacterium]|nr:hypothetical protein [Bacteroidota bacterium]
MLTEVSPLLVRKYNQAIPRYTSYPTVPNWNNTMTEETWKESFHKRFDEVISAVLLTCTWQEMLKKKIRFLVKQFR